MHNEFSDFPFLIFFFLRCTQTHPHTKTSTQTNQHINTPTHKQTHTNKPIKREIDAWLERSVLDFLWFTCHHGLGSWLIMVHAPFKACRSESGLRVESIGKILIQVQKRCVCWSRDRLRRKEGMSILEVVAVCGCHGGARKLCFL